MKEEDFWSVDAMLTDFLFTTDLSIPEISKRIGLSSRETSKRINQLGLRWVKKKNRKLSRGCAALLSIMEQLLPGEEFVTEHSLGEGLRLDIYCPKYKLGAEYHGRQHFFYSNLFYDSEVDFRDAQQRDERKVEICKEQGIALVVFRFNDKLDIETVYDRIMDAIRNTENVKDPKTSNFKGNHYYEKAQQRRREYQKKKYREYKYRNKTK